MTDFTKFIPRYMKQVLAKRPRGVVTADEWNELFNLNIEQGDYNSEWLDYLINDYYEFKEAIGIEVIGELLPKLQAHINDFDNPHKVTKDQVGLGLLENVELGTAATYDVGISSGQIPVLDASGKIPLGNLPGSSAYTYKGIYKTTIQYKAFDAVIDSVDGKLYIATSDNIGGPAPHRTDSAWTLVDTTIDISAKMDKVPSARAYRIACFNSNGQVIDSGTDVTLIQAYYNWALNYTDSKVSAHNSVKTSTEDGAHGLRYYNGFLQYDDNGTWKTIQTGGGGTSESVPVGTILPYYGAVAPDGYLLLDGSSFDSTQYPVLYSLLGTNVLPDARGKVLPGLDVNNTLFNELGKTGGESRVTLTNATIPEHSHGMSHTHSSTNINSSAAGGHLHTVIGSVQESTHTHTKADLVTGKGGAHSHTLTFMPRTSNKASGTAVNSVDGLSGGSSASQFTTGTVAEHTHSAEVTIPNGGSHTHQLTNATAVAVSDHNHSLSFTIGASSLSNTTSTGSGSSHNNLQPYMVVNYIIKY